MTLSISSIDVTQIFYFFLSNSFYDVIFPFLLVYAILFTVLSTVKIFKYKSGEPIKSAIFIVSFVVSLFGVLFEISPGYTVATYLMLLFPNISTLTVLVLVLYVVGAILGKNFFKDVFSKTSSAYLYFVILVIGLGATVYYFGIVAGFWTYHPFDTGSYWNIVIATAFLILGIVFLIIGMIPLGLLLLLVLGVFIANGGQENILLYFIDPIIFIIFIITILLSWVNSGGKDEKIELAKSLQKSELSRKKYFDRYKGRYPENYESRVYDIIDSNYYKKLKKWENEYGNEDWRKF